jgi:murein DD-endopeptidase MepM/ murein hydrolase activator NlpD
VERGQRIATIGMSGRTTGPHLHYSVEVNGESRNPIDYIVE